MDRIVGIDHLGVATPAFVLPLGDLAAARGVPVEKIHKGLGAFEMSVAPPWDDPVTLGANAAARALRTGDIDPQEIGMLLVGTETAVDHAKPVGVFLHELLGLRSACRTVELKHACYGGTAGMMLALEWLRSGAARGRKALVVATDIARYDIGSSAEFTQGAGAVALVLSEAPRLVALDSITGVYARNVYDFWRPLDRREALVDGKLSIECYLGALEGTLVDHRENGGDPDARWAAMLYHAPFPKMTYKAHERFLQHVAVHTGRPMDEVASSFASLVEPTLAAARRVGNSYTASLYLCLASLLEGQAASLVDRPLSFFSYGSGCCAEFFSGRVTASAPPLAGRIGLDALLDDRHRLDVAGYEALARGAGGLGDVAWPRAGAHLVSVQDHRRVYELAGARR